MPATSLPPDHPESLFQSSLPLATKLERARTELLDLSARNRLLNVPRSGKSAKTIEIVDEKSAEIFRLLVFEGKAFTFLPGREASNTKRDEATPEVDADEVLELAQPENDSQDERGVFARHADTKLQTRLTSRGLQKRLLDLYADAITLEQEQGVNILYLALGMLRWIDPKNKENVRHAPLLLIPVSLERGSAGEKFKLKCRAEDFASNLSLEALLDRVHGIRLPAFEATDEFDPATYMEAVAAAVQAKSDWAVLADDIVLGFFSFAKFLMYRDLDPTCWPEEGKISDQPLVRSLLAEGFPEYEDLLPEDCPLDEVLKPSDLLHIVDCDSSQTLAVQEARRGKNLVIQGPPGTGKSQTIANVIASAIADNNTVLFVAEKMAALEVVKRRLDAAGVGDACLELHSNKANKRALLDELRRTWDLGSPRGSAQDSLDQDLLTRRERLNEHVRILHTSHPTAGLTPFQVIGELVRLQREGHPPTELPMPEAPTWTPAARKERETLLDELRQRVEEIGRPSEHPWWGVALGPMMATDVARLSARLTPLSEALRKFLTELDEFTALMQQPAAHNFDAVCMMEGLADRILAAPTLDSVAMASEVWVAEAEDVASVVRQGLRYAQLLGRASELTTLESVLSTAQSEIADTKRVLSEVPGGLSATQLQSAQNLRTLLDQVEAQSATLGALLGRPTQVSSLAEAESLLSMARQIVAAPDLAPAAFTSSRWDGEVERANDIAESLAQLEKARDQVSALISEAAWDVDLSAARQTLAQHGTSITRFLNGTWRQHDRLVRSFLTNPKMPLEQLLPVLDALGKGRGATAAIEREKDFGSDVFGPEWRGAKSPSAHLLALTSWMRGLSKIASPDDRAAARQLASRRTGISQIQTEAEALTVQIASIRTLTLNLRAVVGSQAPFSAWKESLTPVVRSLALMKALFNDIPSSQAAQLELIDYATALKITHAEIEEGARIGVEAFGSIWKSHSSDWQQLSDVLAWMMANLDIRLVVASLSDKERLGALMRAIADVREELKSSLDLQIDEMRFDRRTISDDTAIERMPLRVLLSKLDGWILHIEQLSKWSIYLDRANLARNQGLTGLVSALETGDVSGADVLPAFHMSYYESLFKDQIRLEPLLARFDGTLHQRTIDEFRSLDLQRIKASALDVVRAHHRKIPTGGGIGPLGVLRSEMVKRRGHLPIRQLIHRAAPAIQALKPVMMMSPLSVAQFLSPGDLTFDLLVMDEASQIQPVDALGAIARCRQIVVVGDERQLPPTKFFSKMTSDVPDEEEDSDDTASVGDIESVLGLCAARGLPQRMLRWHYRSQHESLIALSNSQFYENKLHIIPSPFTREAGTGLRFHHIANGKFETGTGANAVEAKYVAEQIIRHAIEHPTQSLGVATFSVRQRKAIQDQLEALRRINPAAESFFTAHPSEPFFVKNLENVQGDERDVIFISVGYGRNENGVFAMRFGPLATDGGERRLNVLISRAKQRCEVFASITDEDIDLERAKGKGVLAFRLFLHYARTGNVQLGRVAEQDVLESVFADQVAHALQSRGYQIHRNIGISGLFVDIAVADSAYPGRYLLGVECDGPGYRSAQSARDRDRLRAAVLLGHGWLLHRVWSIDWLQRPNDELEKLVAAVEEAKVNLQQRNSMGVSAKAVPIEILTVEREETVEVALSHSDSIQGSLYREAQISMLPGYPELHSVPSGVLAQLVVDVVATEGPVHRDEVLARMRTAWGMQRSGGRIQAAVSLAIDRTITDGRTVSTDGFLTVPDQRIRPRDRSFVTSAALRRVEMLPPEELDASVLTVARDNFGGTSEEIIQCVSRALGFKATSSQLKAQIQARIDSLLASGKLKEKAEILTTV